MNKEILEQLENSERIYQDRIHGESEVWSATTHCIVCGAKWLWGVQDNLDFTCPDCNKKINCPNCGLCDRTCDNCEVCRTSPSEPKENENRN